jgi:hypothetical protein
MKRGLQTLHAAWQVTPALSSDRRNCQHDALLWHRVVPGRP